MNTHFILEGQMNLVLERERGSITTFLCQPVLTFPLTGILPLFDC